MSKFLVPSPGLTEEGLVLEVLVVDLEMVLGGGGHLQSHQLVSALLEALDDLTHQVPVHAVGLE